MYRKKSEEEKKVNHVVKNGTCTVEEKVTKFYTKMKKVHEDLADISELDSVAENSEAGKRLKLDTSVLDEAALEVTAKVHELKRAVDTYDPAELVN